MREDITTITIELLGSYTAYHVESGLTVDRGDGQNRNRPKSALGPLCRLLIDDGYNPDARVHVIRKALDRDGYTPVFKRDRALAAWADVDCVETETRSLHVAKHRPFPDAVKGKERRQRPLATEVPRAPLTLPGAHLPKHHQESFL